MTTQPPLTDEQLDEIDTLRHVGGGSTENARLKRDIDHLIADVRRHRDALAAANTTIEALMKAASEASQGERAARAELSKTQGALVTKAGT